MIDDKNSEEYEKIYESTIDKMKDMLQAINISPYDYNKKFKCLSDVFFDINKKWEEL